MLPCSCDEHMSVDWFGIHEKICQLLGALRTLRPTLASEDERQRRNLTVQMSQVCHLQHPLFHIFSCVDTHDVATICVIPFFFSFFVFCFFPPVSSVSLEGNSNMQKHTQNTHSTPSLTSARTRPRSTWWRASMSSPCPEHSRVFVFPSKFMATVALSSFRRTCCWQKPI